MVEEFVNSGIYFVTFGVNTFPIISNQAKTVI